MNLLTVQTQLMQAGVPKMFGTRKEVNYLPQLLSDDEVIQYAASGMYDGNTVLIVLTQKRIMFVDKGMIYGVQTSEIPLDMVNGVSSKSGVLLGEISVMNGVSWAHIKNIPKIAVPVLSDKIKRASEAYKQSLYRPQIEVSQNSQPLSQNLIADELIKLKSLVDNGILTEEEFQAQKAKLLSQ